ncbi:MAG: hypothetical protein Q9183_002995 [Haloplaca sp. 2 TL-2023]
MSHQDQSTSIAANYLQKILGFKPKPTSSADEQQSTQYSGSFDAGDISSSGVPPDGYEPLIDHHDRPSDVDDTDEPEIATLEESVRTPSTFPVTQTQPFFQFQRPTTDSEENPAMGFSYSKPIQPVFNFNTKPSKGPTAAKHFAEHPPSKLSQVIIPDTLPGQLPEPERESRGSSNDRQSQLDGQPNDPTAAKQQYPPDSPALQNTSQASTNMIPETEYNAPTDEKQGTGQSHPASPAGSHHSVEDGDNQVLEGQTLIDVLPASPINVPQSASATPSPRRQFSRPSHHSSSRNTEPSTPSALTKPRAPTKVQKPSRVPRTPSSPARSLRSIVTAGQTPNPKKALRTLQMYYHKQEEYQDEIQAWKEARDMEIQDLETISQALHSQLQQSEQQVTSLTRQLAQHHERVPKWQERIKKLGDFVNGLSRDHTRLREDAKAMSGELTQLQTFKETITREVEVATLGSQNKHSRHHDQLSKTRQIVESLQQELNTRNAELEKESIRLQSEQARTERLEGSLAASTTQQQTLIAKLSQQEDNLSSKINDLSNLINSLHDHTPPTNQDDLQQKLEECLSLLKEPRDAVSTSQASLEKLELSIQTVIDGICGLDATSKSNAVANSKHLNTLSFELASKMQTVTTILHTDQPVKAQVGDLREAKATINERLRATEVDLISSRMQANAAAERERQQSQKIVALETELKTMRQRQNDSSSLQSQRLYDAEKQCRDLSQRLGDRKSELQAAAADVKTARAESDTLQRSLDAGEATITKLQAQLEVVTTEKAKIQTEAQENEKKIRAEASEAHRLESTRAAGQSANEILQLSWHVDQKKKELAEVREQKNAQNKELDKVQEKLRIVEHDKMITTNGLRAELDKMRVENTALRAEKQGCENTLAAANEEIQKQQARIRELTESASGSRSLHPIVDSNAPVDKSNGSPFEEFFMLEDAEALDFIGPILDVSQEREPELDNTTRALVSGDTLNMIEERRPAVLRGTIEDSQAKATARRIVEDSQDKWPRHTSQRVTTMTDESQNIDEHRRPGPTSRTVQDAQAKISARPVVEDSQDKWPQDSSVRDASLIDKSQEINENRRLGPSNRTVEKSKTSAPPVVEDPQDKGPQPLAPAKATISSDTQDKNGQKPRGILKKTIEESQDKAANTPKRRGPLRLASSPLTEDQISSPVTDGRVMFPPYQPNPLPNNAGGVEPSKQTRRRTSSQETSWTMNTSTTKIKSQSFTAHRQGRPVSRSSVGPSDRHSPSRSTSSRPSPFVNRVSNPSSALHLPPVARDGSIKRSKPNTQTETVTTATSSKRRKLSMETEKYGLGPTQTSPPTSSAATHRKRTLRRPQKGQSLAGSLSRPD